MLSHANISLDGRGPFGTDPAQIGTSGSTKIFWNAGSGANRKSCKLSIQPSGETNSLMKISCEGADATALRNGAIELIDAILTRRPYDPALAQGDTAEGWPEPPEHKRTSSYQSREDTMEEDWRREEEQDRYSDPDEFSKPTVNTRPNG